VGLPTIFQRPGVGGGVAEQTQIPDEPIKRNECGEESHRLTDEILGPFIVRYMKCGDDLLVDDFWLPIV